MRARNPFDLLPGLRKSAVFSIQYALEIISDRLSKLDAERYGISINEFLVLLASDERDIHQGLIAECLGINKNVMVKLINQAEKKRLVRRIPDPRDQRASLIKPTRKGRGILHAGLKDQRELWAIAFAPLRGEQIDRAISTAVAIIEDHHRKRRKRKA